MKNESMDNLKIYIDPSYQAFNSDRLFELKDPVLNRDSQLLPFHRFRTHMQSKGVSVQTADFLTNDINSVTSKRHYHSLGIVDNFERIYQNGSAVLKTFVIMEPPVVLPALYAALPRLTAIFDSVYLHNTNGNGYSLKGVDTTKLKRLYWPIPHNDVLFNYWEHSERLKRVVVINGNHNAHGRNRELYSVRIKAMAELSRLNVVDLYGIGWNRWWSRNSFWLPYWLNLRALMSIYKGSCVSKFEVLQNYEFCLCFENMEMEGYITEKIFDCVYAGIIPLYLGAPDILKYIPEDVFVDCRNYSSWTEMWEDVSKFSPEKVNEMRLAGRRFIKSDMAKKFYDSIQNIFEP